LPERDAIAAALDLLPWWVAWANVLLIVPLSALIAALSAWVAIRVARDEAAAVAPNFIGAGPLLLAAVPFFLGDQLQHVASAGAAGLTWLASLAAAIVVTRGARTRSDASAATAAGELRRREALTLAAALVSWFARPTLATALAFILDPARPAFAIACAIVALAAYLALGRRTFGHAFARSGLFQPPSPRLSLALARAAERAARPPPPAFEIDLPSADPLGSPGARWLVVPRRAIALLDDAALAAFCHCEVELLAASGRPRLSTALGHAALAVIAGARVEARWLDPLAITALAVALLLAAAIAQRAVVRQAQRVALARASAHEGEPGLVERALAQLRAAGRSRAPQPARPKSRRRLVAKIAGGLVIALPIAPTIVTALHSTIAPAELLDWPRDVALALGNQPQDELIRRSSERRAAGHDEEAEQLLGAAAALDPEDASTLRRIAFALFVVRSYPCDPEPSDDR